MDLVADTGIDWGMLQAWFQNVWSAKTLRRKWVLLKSSVDGFQNKTHRGLLMLPTHTMLSLSHLESRDYHIPSHAILFPSMISDTGGRKLGNTGSSERRRFRQWA